MSSLADPDPHTILGIVSQATPESVALLLAPGRVPLTYAGLQRLIEGAAAQLRAAVVACLRAALEPDGIALCHNRPAIRATVAIT